MQKTIMPSVYKLKMEQSVLVSYYKQWQILYMIGEISEDCLCNCECNDYVINIKPDNTFLVPGKYVRQNIAVENNTFRICDYPVLFAHNVGRLKLKNNDINWGKFMQAGCLCVGIKLFICDKVTVENNLF